MELKVVKKDFNNIRNSFKKDDIVLVLDYEYLGHNYPILIEYLDNNGKFRVLFDKVIEIKTLNLTIDAETIYNLIKEKQISEEMKRMFNKKFNKKFLGL